MLRRTGKRVALAAILAAVIAGCTPNQYGRQADKAAYKALAGGQAASLGESKPFDVRYEPFRSSDQEPCRGITVGRKVVPIGEGQSVVVTLEECLEIAFRNGREYQGRKEDTYALALNLANMRRGWDAPVFSGDLAGEIGASRQPGPDPDNSASSSAGPSLEQRFRQGAVLTLAATLDWSTDFLPGSGSDNLANSLLEANLTQPLLQGAWRGLAYENQYRLERDFLFAVFAYERFRQTFAARVYGQYYSVLRQRDQLENDRMSIERQKTTLAVTKVQVEGGMLTRIDEDRAEQALLNAQVSFEQSQQSYRNSLDTFKILIGLPVEAGMEVDYPATLHELAKAGPLPIDLAEDAAVRIALAARPDVLTERAKVRDAARNVDMAADKFLPQLDVEMGISAPSEPPHNFQEVRFDRHARFAKATFNYQLDQTDNRDSYCLAVIARQKSGRDLDEFLDRVVLDVRAAYRELVQSKQSYELQERSVVIATRRHRLAQLQQKQGELSPTDVLDAEQDLRQAENGRTSALVSYNNTRVRFLADLGLLDVNEKGSVHERTEPIKFDRIGRRYPYVQGD